MTSLCWNRPVFSGLTLIVVFKLIGILMESNILSFFEHIMRFLCYSTALCFKLIGFSPKGRPEMCQSFEFL